MGFRKFPIGGLPPRSSGSARTVSTLQYLAVAMFGALLVVMAYGLYYVPPAAPIRYVDGQYVDKRGGVHTRSGYERLRVWERVSIGSWVAAAVSAASYQFAKRRGL